MGPKETARGATEARTGTVRIGLITVERGFKVKWGRRKGEGLTA